MYVGGVNGYVEGVGNPTWEGILIGEGKGVVFEGSLRQLLVSAVTVQWCGGKVAWGGVWCGEREKSDRLILERTVSRPLAVRLRF